MKKPVVDYRKLRWSTRNDPEFSHVRLLWGWIGYFILFFLTEKLIPYDKCHLIHTKLDDLIPFCEYFVIPYYSWYALCFFSLLYFVLYDVDRFKQLQVFIMITQLLAMLCYIFFPSRQDLRPEVFPRENFFTWVISGLYAFDTNTGVCPSLHVAYSLGIGSVWLKYEGSSRVWKIFLVVWIITICLATAFIKQHSVMDGLAAIPVGIVAEIFTFHVIKYKKVPDNYILPGGKS